MGSVTVGPRDRSERSGSAQLSRPEILGGRIVVGRVYCPCDSRLARVAEPPRRVAGTWLSPGYGVVPFSSNRWHVLSHCARGALDSGVVDGTGLTFCHTFPFRRLPEGLVAFRTTESSNE